MLVLVHVGVFCAVVSVSCSLVYTCWKMADLLAVVFVVFCHFPKRVSVHIRTKGEVGVVKLFKPSSKTFLLTVPRRYFLCGLFVLFLYCVCHAVVSAHCCFVVTCWERSDLLSPVCALKLCLCYFPMWYPGSGEVLDLSIPDRCPLSYLNLPCIYIFQLL